MGVAVTHQIAVWVKFPNKDIHKRPSVENPTTQKDVIDAGSSHIEWSLGSNQGFPINNDHLTITGVTFYSDAEKKMQVEPAFLNLPGGNNGRMNWIIGINPGVVPETTLYYTIHYKDDDFPALDWDPTLTVKARPS